ncbi:hypothetical protein COU17_01155 [Candidatus Kaiserbacteria bacterium CG10_big_fil_rev_8_21_14_0_10_49_17]|uniref:VTT domain-containing protein n=1 Tax=Candidatus Kaiserbacteria bacterium CG10_big_fil_rev_8_21_14_0_10_49_17 TaxID=1974609 RepID=A0A2M6WES6_9BACT|nr:MAG: hypothetical protein COU17_01155 [Candidatus Kaiserbacteria bacterium CG10_big_fil_rev_8_21_14_0_10_49_17]
MRTYVFLFLNILVIGGLVGLMVFSVVADGPLKDLRELIGANTLLTVGVVVALTFIATVIAPITTILIVPTAAGFIGPFLAGLSGWVGWFFGSLVAFAIARHFGKPLLLRFISEEKLALYERYVPERFGFVTLLFLRMVIAPDVLSYAVGIFSRITWKPYTLATLFGLAPFAFIGAYAGGAFFSQNYTALLALVLLGGSLYFFVFRYIVKQYNNGIR